MRENEGLNETPETERKVRVLVCRVGQEPAVEEVLHELTRLQNLVGGYLEAVGLGDGVDLWCNDSGRIDGLPFNRDVPGRAPWIPDDELDLVICVEDGLARPGEMGIHRVHGDFFLARVDDQGEMVSLIDADLAKYSTILGASPSNTAPRGGRR